MGQGPAAEEALSEPEQFPVRTWLIALAGWAFDFYDLILFSFLLTPIARDLALSEPARQTLLGIALGASGVGGMVFGHLADRYGRRSVMVWTILIYSAGTALTAAAMGPISLALARFVTGLGVGGEWAIGHALLAESAPARMRGRAAALLQAGEPLGVGLAAVVGFLVEPVIGWRVVCVLSSASALLALVVRRHLPESALWEAGAKRERTAIEAMRYLRERGLLGTLAKGWLLAVFKLGTYWTCYIWLPSFMQHEFNQPVGRSALWILTSQTGQLAGMLAFGEISDRWGRRITFTGYSIVTAIALAPLAFAWRDLVAAPGAFWAVMLLLGLGSGCTAGFGALMAELFPTEVRNFAMGTAYNCARGVQFFAPIVVGHAKDAGGVAGALSVPLVLALATAGWVWALPETRGRDLARIG